MKKKKFLISLLLFISFSLSAKTINDTQVIQTGHWIYDALYTLGMEQKLTGFYENSMLSVGELKFYFNEIDYDKLSESGKNLYSKAHDFLFENSSLYESKAFKFSANAILNPELYYKSNSQIPWSFRYCYDDNLVTVPLQFAFSNFITIETDPFFGKTNIATQRPENFCNIPYLDEDFEFLFPRFAYGNTGYVFDGWGINFQIGKQGLQIGNTKNGSIFYNDTFETDQFIQMNLFSDVFKYSLDVVQINQGKNLYLHEIEARFFKQLKVFFIEGSMLNGAFELRFLNPLMVMHSMSAWNDYNVDYSDYPYGEDNFCAYFGGGFDWTPVKYTRIYCLYAQNELQTASERAAWYGSLYPNSLGLQFGAEVKIPSASKGYWNGFAEATYTSPYLYIKHTPKGTLYCSRQDNMSSDYIKSWIGNPYGPDFFGIQTGFGYEKTGKWKVNFTYSFAEKGEKDFSMLDIKSTYSGNNPMYKDEEFYTYYPIVKFRTGDNSEELHEECKEDALNMWMTGIVQITNKFILSGEYILNDHLSLKGQFGYSFVNNTSHIEDNFQQGIECVLAVKTNLF